MQAELVLFIARMMNHYLAAQGYSLATVKGFIIQNIAETIIMDLLENNDLHAHNITRTICILKSLFSSEVHLTVRAINYSFWAAHFTCNSW